MRYTIKRSIKAVKKHLFLSLLTKLKSIPLLRNEIYHKKINKNSEETCFLEFT